MSFKGFSLKLPSTSIDLKASLTVAAVSKLIFLKCSVSICVNSSVSSLSSFKSSFRATCSGKPGVDFFELEVFLAENMLCEGKKFLGSN